MTSPPRSLPSGLAGPVDLQLAKAEAEVPGETAMSGGSRYELKWDGYRCAAVCRGGAVRLWSRNGKEFTDKFPDVQLALEAQVEVDCVLDGELVVWSRDRLDFDALQRRMVNSAATVRRRMVSLQPASYVVFDVLAIDGVDLRPMRWSTRRQRLESLADGWRPPLQVSPVTASVAEAREWMTAFAPAGIEGLVIKGAASRYVAARQWIKVKAKSTTECLVGGVLGSLTRPEVVIGGRYRGEELIQVGRSVPLTPSQSIELGRALRPGPSDHPWPDQVGTGRWGGAGSTKVPLVKVDPTVVIEVSADAAQQVGQWRHPFKVLRIRTDQEPGDVEQLP